MSDPFKDLTIEDAREASDHEQDQWGGAVVAV